MLLNFTDEMELVSGGDLAYAFYKKVNLDKNSNQFRDRFGGFSLHQIIQYTKIYPEFCKVMEDYLNEK
jgi:hypothetical protein